MKRKHKEIILLTILLLFTGTSFVLAGIEEAKWPVCEAINITGSECDNFWNGLNLTDDNLTTNITIEYYNQTYINETVYENKTYNFDNESYYNKTEIDTKLTNLDNKIGTSGVDLNSYARKVDIEDFVLPNHVSLEINKSLNNYSGMSNTWEWTIILNWIVTLGIIVTIIFLVRME